MRDVIDWVIQFFPEIWLCPRGNSEFATPNWFDFRKSDFGDMLELKKRGHGFWWRDNTFYPQVSIVEFSVFVFLFLAW